MTDQPSGSFTLLSPGFAIKDAEQIVEPAAALFAEKGFDGATMQELADRAGVAKATLFTYVQTKQRILEAVFDHLVGYAERSLRDAAAKPTASEQLRTVIRTFTQGSVELRTYYTVYFGEQQALEPAAREHMLERTRAVVKTIRRFVTDGQESGEISRALDPGVVTFGIISLAQWTGQWLTADGPLDWDAVAAQFGDMIFDGIAIPPRQQAAAVSNPVRRRNRKPSPSSR